MLPSKRKEVFQRRKGEWNKGGKKNVDKTVNELEEASKALASCSYEKNTKWGKEVTIFFHSSQTLSNSSLNNDRVNEYADGIDIWLSSEDVTGLTIQCRGWKSVFPERAAFLGVAPTTLDEALIQYKRWSEGTSQIFLSRYCPFTYGHGKIELGPQMGCAIYLLWAPISLPTLCYVIVPSLCFLNGISIFPKVSSLWFVPLAYIFVTKNS